LKTNNKDSRCVRGKWILVMPLWMDLWSGPMVCFIFSSVELPGSSTGKALSFPACRSLDSLFSVKTIVLWNYTIVYCNMTNPQASI
jgi:hypothetical protein